YESALRTTSFCWSQRRERGKAAVGLRHAQWYRLCSMEKALAYRLEITSTRERSLARLEPGQKPFSWSMRVPVAPERQRKMGGKGLEEKTRKRGSEEANREKQYIFQ